MQTLQFKTYVKNGTIKIPEPFQEWQNRELTVILLIPEEKTEERQRRFLNQSRNILLNFLKIIGLTAKNSMRDNIFLDTHL